MMASGGRCAAWLMLLASLPAASDPAASNDASDAGPAVSTQAVFYRCDDLGFIVRPADGLVTLSFEDRTVVLQQVPAASGTRYEGGTTLFWGRGDEAMLEIDGHRYTGCHGDPAGVPWEEARRRGIDFRATGNEPGWILELDGQRRLTLVTDYGQRRIQAHVPAADPRLEWATYRSSSANHDLTVTVQRHPCRDSMSGQQFPASVSVTLDGVTYQGCGRRLR